MSQGNERVRQYDMWAFSACHQKTPQPYNYTQQPRHPEDCATKYSAERTEHLQLSVSLCTDHTTMLHKLLACTGWGRLQKLSKNTWRAFAYLSTANADTQKDLKCIFQIVLPRSISSRQNLLITYVHNQLLIDYVYIKSLLL